MGRSVSDGGHEGVLGLRHVQAGALHHDGAVRLHQNGVGLVAGNGLALVIDLLVQADVVGALVLADGVEATEGLGVLKENGEVDVSGLARQVQHADGLVADELALDGVAHVAVGNEPSILSDHVFSPFGGGKWITISIAQRYTKVKRESPRKRKNRVVLQ